MNQPIYPCLWFNGNAREAATFYCSVFSHSKITADNPLVVLFESSGQQFMCLNGGPEFVFNPSVSFFVVCESESEIDSTWKHLAEGGKVLMPIDKYDWSEKYGWVQDKYGVNWQLAFGKMQEKGQKFSPVMMFTGEMQGKAEEAVHYYTSVFKPSSITGILKYTAEDDDKEGTVKHAQFRLGQNVVMAMDSSLPHGFSFNEAISLVVECDSQEDIDYYWSKLSEGGTEGHCGWLKDRYGMSWQIVPVVLKKLMSEPERSARVVQAFMQMKKFNIDQLMRA